MNNLRVGFRFFLEIKNYVDKWLFHAQNGFCGDRCKDEILSQREVSMVRYPEIDFLTGT